MAMVTFPKTFFLYNEFTVPGRCKRTRLGYPDKADPARLRRRLRGLRVNSIVIKEY